MSASKNDYKAARIIWFNDEKGFGYAEDEVGNLIFVHYSAIAAKAKARRSLEKDQQVELQCVEELGELRATKVREVNGNA